MCKNKSFWDAPENFTIGLLYVAPSSDRSLLTFNLPFKVILRRFIVVFWCLKLRMLHCFQTTDENWLKTTNTIYCGFKGHVYNDYRGMEWDVAILWMLRALHGNICGIYSLKKITLFTLFSLLWVVTSVITSLGVNIEWTGRDFTRWVVNFHSTGVRIEWNSLLNEWNLFTP